MKSILLQPTSTAQFYTLVNDAESACALQLDEELESYLVFLLMRFAQKPEMATSVLALEFLEGMAAPGKLRMEMLKDVGDKCLLFSGLFPERTKRRRVKDTYFIDLGQNAYYVLASACEQRCAYLYENLSEQFLPMRNVLHAMRLDQAELHAQSNPFKLLTINKLTRH